MYSSSNRVLLKPLCNCSINYSHSLDSSVNITAFRKQPMKWLFHIDADAWWRWGRCILIANCNRQGQYGCLPLVDSPQLNSVSLMCHCWSRQSLQTRYKLLSLLSYHIPIPPDRHHRCLEFIVSLSPTMDNRLNPIAKDTYTTFLPIFNLLAFLP